MESMKKLKNVLKYFILEEILNSSNFIFADKAKKSRCCRGYSSKPALDEDKNTQQNTEEKPIEPKKEDNSKILNECKDLLAKIKELNSEYNKTINDNDTVEKLTAIKKELQKDLAKLQKKDPPAGNPGENNSNEKENNLQIQEDNSERNIIQFNNGDVHQDQQGQDTFEKAQKGQDNTQQIKKLNNQSENGNCEYGLRIEEDDKNGNDQNENYEDQYNNENENNINFNQGQNKKNGFHIQYGIWLNNQFIQEENDKDNNNNNEYEANLNQNYQNFDQGQN